MSRTECQLVLPLFLAAATILMVAADILDECKLGTTVSARKHKAGANAPKHNMPVNSSSDDLVPNGLTVSLSKAERARSKSYLFLIKCSSESRF
jgi:hypothetical protein